MRLPDQLQPPRPLSTEQGFLPLWTSTDLLSNLDLCPEEIARWRSLGWLGTERIPDSLHPEDPWLHRLGLLKDLTRSGLSDTMITLLLRDLPFFVDSNLVAYSFRHGWVQPAESDEQEDEDGDEPEAPDFDTVLEDWISEATEDEIKAVLGKLVAAIS